MNIHLSTLGIWLVFLVATVATRHQIILFGRTGSGKSYVLNRLRAPGQPQVQECWDNFSCTKNLTSVEAFNGDMITEVPGYFDTDGQDRANQVIFVDFIKGRSIRAILFLFTDKADSFMQAASNAFKISGIGSNLIFVKNKVMPNSPEPEIEELLGSKKVAIKVMQENMDALKNEISRMTLVTPTHMVTPVSLFRLPLEIVKEEVVEVFVQEKNIPVKVTTRRSAITGSTRACKRTWYGRKKCWDEPVWGEITEDSYPEMPHRVFEKIKLTYAMRFDGAADIYTKEHVAFNTVQI